VLKIGLTGGIGSGKSTAAKYFAKLNIPVIDADKIAHEFLQPNTIIYKKIIAHFGKNFLTPKNTLDRTKIRQLIFHNKKARIWLEQLVHPYIRAEMQKRMTAFKTPYCVMVIPLIFETKFPPRVDRILTIDCPKTTQINRIRKRNRYPIKQIKAMIATQVDRNKRLKHANDVIINNGTLGNLKKTIKKWHDYYLSLV
jgi:dephospho-CoA kinase